jgi:hypothetical protein
VQLVTDEFGESAVALNRERVQWTSAAVLSWSVPAARAPKATPLLKCSKIDLILRLRQQGFEDPGVKKLAPWVDGGMSYFRSRLICPLSYFGALVMRWQIYEKRVTEIKHGMPDKYYRLLLFAESSRLLPLLALIESQGMESLTQAAFKEAVGEAGTEGTEHEGDCGDGAPLPLSDLDRAALPMIFARAILWERCEVDAGSGTERVRVYFTGLDDGLHQRGFTPCAATNSCKWMVIHLQPSREQFCAYMYLWHRRSIEVPGLGKEAHMAYEPDAASVPALVPTLRLTPF